MLIRQLLQETLGVNLVNDGWLSPEGKVYRLPSQSIEHASAMRLGLIPVRVEDARKVAETRGIKTDDMWDPWQNKALMHMGWVRLKNMMGMIPGKKCLFADYVRINRRQKEVLEDLQFNGGWHVLHGDQSRMSDGEPMF